MTLLRTVALTPCHVEIDSTTISCDWRGVTLPIGYSSLAAAPTAIAQYPPVAPPRPAEFCILDDRLDSCRKLVSQSQSHLNDSVQNTIASEKSGQFSLPAQSQRCLTLEAWLVLDSATCRLHTLHPLLPHQPATPSHIATRARSAAPAFRRAVSCSKQLPHPSVETPSVRAPGAVIRSIGTRRGTSHRPCHHLAPPVRGRGAGRGPN